MSKDRMPVAREFVYDPFMEYAKKHTMWIVRDVMIEEMKERLKRKYQALGEEEFMEEFGNVLEISEEEGDEQ